ncbi:O-antigen polymerase [Chitinophagaceae bacterium MMS25-I14]
MIAVFLIYLFTVFFLRKQYGSFLVPPLFLLMYWFLQLYIPVIIAGSFYYSGSAFLFIYLCIFAFAAGFMLTTHKLKPDRDDKTFSMYVSENRHLLIRMQIVLLLFSVALAIFELAKYGYSITKIQSFAAIETISRDISVARLEGTTDEKDSAVSSILKIPFYASFLVSGMLVKTVNKKVIYKYLNFLIGLFLMLITTKKTYLLNPIVLFFATYLLLPGITANKKKNTTKIIYGSILSIILIGFFYYSQANRYGLKIGESSIVLDRMSVYFFGHTSVFSLWYDQQPFFNHYEFGKYNFSGIISMIDRSSDLKEGVFTEFMDLNSNGLRSNIYTAYRGWLEDFGYYSIAIHFFFGALIGISYKEYRERYAPFAFMILSMFYAYVLWSFVINLFNYTTIFLAYFLLALNLQLWNKKRPILSLSR